MKINFFAAGFSGVKYKNSTNTPSSRPNLDRDIFTPSFGHKKPTLQEKIDEIGRENIPGGVLEKAEEIIAQGRDDRKTSLAQVHYQVYSPLKDCLTLEDAKKKFSEFSCVLTLEEALSASGMPKAGLQQVKNGEIEGLTADNVVPAFLKFRYCNEHLEGFDFEANRTLYKRGIKYLHFPELNGKYINYVKANSAETTSTARKTLATLWETNSTFAENARAAARRTQAANYQDPKFREMMAQISGNRLRELWADPGSRQKGVEKSRAQMNELWKNPAFRAVRTEQMHRLMTAFHESLPEDIKSTYEEVAKKFPELAGILTKIHSGKQLTEAESVIYKKYCKDVHEACPEIAILQSEYFTQWQSFYYHQVLEEYEKGDFKIPVESDK